MSRDSRFLTCASIALVGSLLALPLPAWAQDTTTATTASTSPALISLFLLVVGLLALGIVAARVVILPGLNSNLSAAAFADDDDDITNPAASDKLA